jgi:hypothetical protein
LRELDLAALERIGRISLDPYRRCEEKTGYAETETD